MSCTCGAAPLISEATVLLGISLEKYMLPCQTKAMLGFDCPGCGIQRSIQFLVNGELWQAFKMYPAIYPMIGFFLALLINLIKPKAIPQKGVIILAFSTITLILANFIYKLFL